MKTGFDSIRVGIFFLLGLALIYSVYAVIGSGRLSSSDGYTVRAVFEDIGTISSGADVRMAGVRIGQVEATRLEAGKGVLLLRIEPEVAIPADSVARLTQSSLLGQSYVDMDYGQSGERLEAGAEVLAESGATFGEILTELQQAGENLNAALGGMAEADFGNVGELVDNLNALVGENRGRIDNLMVNLEAISDKLNSGQGTLGKLINEEGLYAELTATVGDFRTAAGDLQESLSGVRELTEQVRAGDGTLGRLLTDDTIVEELEATAANLRQFSEDLRDGNGTLGKLVSDDSLYYKLQGMVDKADQALSGVGDSGPITAVGAVSGALF